MNNQTQDHMIFFINSNSNLKRQAKILFKSNDINKMDELYKQIGEFGLFQKIQVALIGCTSALVAMLCRYKLNSERHHSPILGVIARRRF